MNIPEKIIGIKYGKYGKEEQSLIIVTESGALLIKTLGKNINLSVIIKFC